MNPADLAPILRQLPDAVLLDRAVLSDEQRARMLRSLDDEELVLVVVGQIDGVRPRPRPSAPRQRPPHTRTSPDPSEASILAFVAGASAPVSISDVVEQTGVARSRAQRALAALAASGKLTVTGRRRGTRYSATNGTVHTEQSARA